MKTFIILCLFSFSSILYAQNPNNKETKEIEEFTSYTIGNIQKRAKVVYKFNTEGQRIERTLYYRDNMKDWTPIQMYNYQYNNQGKIADIIYTKWDKENNCWNETSDHLTHIYDRDGILLSIRKSNSNNDINLAHN